jgi:hypothetical protein
MLCVLKRYREKKQGAGEKIKTFLSISCSTKERKFTALFFIMHIPSHGCIFSYCNLHFALSGRQ